MSKSLLKAQKETYFLPYLKSILMVLVNKYPSYNLIRQ